MTRLGSIKWLVMVFCLLAGTRVAIYLAAFPFFNNVDEIMHYDLVMKYSTGHVPVGLEPLSSGSARCMAGFSSAEYALPYQNIEKRFKPFYLSDTNDVETKTEFEKNCRYWQSFVNYESGLGPLYYSVAGLWARIGITCGLCQENSLALLYWIRFLNVFFIMALVWLGFRAAQLTFPGNTFMAVAVPLLLAVIPQDTFYSIQNDVLSPLCFGWTFVFVVNFIRSPQPTGRQMLQLGTAMALTVLVKSSNLPVIILATVPVAVRAIRLSRAAGFRDFKRPFLLFLFSAFLPLLGLFVWNLHAHGDIFASEEKIKALSWAHKPFGEWLNTGFLTSKGMAIFWKGLMTSFWCGELVWASQQLIQPGMSMFYWMSSIVFLLPATSLLFGRHEINQKKVNQFMFWSFFLMLVFIMVLSLSFEYRGSVYPTFERPYFTSGRLISGALIPFVMLYLSGFSWLLSWLKSEKIKITLIAILAIIICLSEYQANKPVFSSPYNLYAAIK